MVRHKISVVYTDGCKEGLSLRLHGPLISRDTVQGQVLEDRDRSVIFILHTGSIMPAHSGQRLFRS